MMKPTLRVRLSTGDVRQGRYVRRDRETVTIFDGRTRRIPFRSIVSIDDIKIPYEACLSAD